MTTKLKSWYCTLFFLMAFGLGCENIENMQEENKMNTDVVAGYVKEFKGKVKEKYGEFTDDEITKMEGKASALAGELQRKYGYAKEQARDEAQKLLRELQNTES